MYAQVHAQIEAEIASLKRTVAAAVSTAQATANEAVAKVNNTFAKKPWHGRASSCQAQVYKNVNMYIPHN